MRRRDRLRQVAHVVIDAVHRDVEPRLALVAVAEVAHAQRRRVRRVETAGDELLEPVHLAALQERRTDRRRVAEEIQDDPAVTAVVAQQREVAVGAEVLARVVALAEVGEDRPEVLGERVVEVHARDGLHHATVAVAEAAPVDGLHRADVRLAVLGDRDALLALDGARHAGRPEQLVVQVAVDELVQVAEVLQQLPGVRERRRDQLDQRLGVVGGDVLVGQGRPEGPRVGGLRDQALGGDPQGFLLGALEAALEGVGGLGVHQGGQAAVEGAGGRHLAEFRDFGQGWRGYQSRPTDRAGAACRNI